MSNQTKHTPGPWRLCDDTHDSGLAIVDAPCLRIVVDHREDFGKARPDARLIAAAPELLEACKAGLESYISLWESEFQTSADHKCTDLVVAKMKAAIAKAEGRTP